ncbi:MAG: linear amide C-N hydrolase [Lachnospiraceae bacterium]|nr:linear amide C-N hydrolase [Lachnospiraceae bacterium]
MQKNKLASVLLLLTSVLCLAGCGNGETDQTAVGSQNEETLVFEENMEIGNLESVSLNSEIRELENGLSAVKYEGDYGFDAFLSVGGASSDREVVSFLAENLLSDMNIGFSGGTFGCSTISVKSEGGDFLFGRNFDWNSCNAMVVASYPENGYASISTVNMDFVSQGAGGGITGMALKMDDVKVLASLYAPLDGLNEKGLAVSVNMIQDGADISQDSDKPDITTTTAIRLLLDKAANVDEALALLDQYDMHASMGMMVHFALADTAGRSVAVEYIGNEMVVTDTPVVTNFYLAEGEKHGIGTKQSHERYEILVSLLEESGTMDMAGVRDALDRVSKDNFGEFESTEWSIVFNQTDGQAVYYHREDYGKGYVFAIE